MATKNPTKKESSPVMDTVPAGTNTAEEGVDAIRISENVIASVTKKYVLEIPGVIGFHSGSIVSGLAEMIGRKSQDRSVVVSLEGDAVHIGVNLVLKFGVKVPEIASQVQDTIRSKVEELTGKHVTGVRVTIQDLKDVPDEEAEAEEEG